MRSTSELSALWLWLCCASLLLLAFTSLCPAVANPQRRSALHSSPSDLPTTFSFSSLPPEQQRIRLEYLTPAYLHVPYLPIPSLSTPSPSPSPFQPPPTCPCSNSTLCLPLFLPPRPELFIFQVRPSDWSSYDWSSLTTVVLTTHLDPALLCYAHAHSARLVLLTDLTPQQLTNASYRSAWVTSNVHAVASTHIDGLNVDFESPLNATGAAVYSELVKELGEWLRSEVKGSQLTVDVAWSPNCIDGRCYDVVALAAEVDFLFVMAYDMRSQIFDLDDCRASANSPIRLVEAGLRNYTRLGVQPHKLVLGVPWSASHTTRTSLIAFPCSSSASLSPHHCCCLSARPLPLLLLSVQVLLRLSVPGRHGEGRCQLPHGARALPGRPL